MKNRNTIKIAFLILITYLFIHFFYYAFSVMTSYDEYMNPRIFGYRYTDYFMIITFIFSIFIIYLSFTKSNSKIQQSVLISTGLLAIIFSIYMYKGVRQIEQNITQHRQFLTDQLVLEILGLNSHWRGKPEREIFIKQLIKDIEFYQEIEVRNDI